MQIVSSLSPLALEHEGGTAVAMGYFDGIHIGHRAVIEGAVEWAKAHGAAPAVFTFKLPADSKMKGRRLLSTEDKHALIASLGVEYYLCPEFEEIRAMTPEQFVYGIVQDCHAKALFCGENFTFGAKAAGTPELLKELCAPLGVEVVVVPMAQFEEKPVSSTRIRTALEGGDVPAANAMLGMPYAIRFAVQHGNCGVSMLTGTAFGTAATMGTICVSVGISMGMDPVLLGGAMLSGVYFGDRCSPVSTSALLVSELTETNIYDNIKRMLKTALVPFLLSCGVYAALGMVKSGSGAAGELWSLYGREMTLHWVMCLPAVLILILSVLRVNVKKAMSVSILAAVVLCIFLRHLDAVTILKTAILGYTASDAEVGAMLNGGGIISMVRVALIVMISSAYSGIFRKTGLLDGLCGRPAHRHGRRGGQPALRRHRLARFVLHDRKARRKA